MPSHPHSAQRLIGEEGWVYPAATRRTFAVGVGDLCYWESHYFGLVPARLTKVNLDGYPNMAEIQITATRGTNLTIRKGEYEEVDVISIIARNSVRRRKYFSVIIGPTEVVTQS